MKIIELLKATGKIGRMFPSSIDNNFIVLLAFNTIFIEEYTINYNSQSTLWFFKTNIITIIQNRHEKESWHILDL